MKPFGYYLSNPWRIAAGAGYHGFLNWLDDEKYLKLQFRAHLGYPFDLSNPRTFNEKLQWLKLHDRNPLYNTLVDKYAAKAWVADSIGAEYIVPTYGAWESVDDIDLDALPERFVLKTNHDSGGIAICGDRASFDFEAAKAKLRRCLKRNYYWGNREWPYKNVKPLVFAEKYLDPAEGASEPADYKLFRFSNGRIVTLVCKDRLKGAGMSETFFDEEWHPLAMARPGHPVDADANRPDRFEDMRRIADGIAEGFPFARIDFYESAGRLYFGEVTLYPTGGFEGFRPESWDAEMGSWIDLSLAYGARGGVAPCEGGFHAVGSRRRR